MNWRPEDEEEQFRIIDTEDPDFTTINDENCRNKRDCLVIDCDRLSKKRYLNDHEKWQKKICDALK